MTTIVAWLLALALRSTVVLGVALAFVAVLRRRRVRACHGLLTLTAASLLLLPALSALLPRWELPLPRLASSEPGPVIVRMQPGGVIGVPVLARPEAERHVAPASVLASAESVGSSASASAPQPTSLVYGAAAASLWLVGVLASLLGLSLALLRERRLLSRAQPLGGPWVELLAEVRRSMGVSRPVCLLASEGIEAPMTGGWRRPVVLLPPGAELWSDERKRVVVQHELVHVLRGDALRHLLWRFAVSVYWWNPLARLAAREASVVGEHACDETVLELGTRPSAYARHLLEIAESTSLAPRRLAHALPMVERSQLERRLHMILDHDRAAGSGRVLAAAAAALLAATVAVVAAATPATSAAPTVQPAAEDPAAVAAPARPAAATPARGTAPAAPASAATGAAASVCRDGMSGSFSGTVDEGPSGSEWTGSENGNFTLQHNLGGGRRLCATVKGPVRFDERDGSIREMPAGSSVAVETRAGDKSQRMRVTGEAGSPRYEWWINGATRPVDDSARAWLAHALEVVADYRAIGSIQGQVGSLQGEIGSIQGQVGSLQGEIGSIQGRIGSLQGDIGSIEGERGGMEGRIGGEEGAIGGLEGRRWQASAAEKASIDKDIASHRTTIEKLRAEMESRQFDRRIADAQAQLQGEEKKAKAEIAALERKIEDVHADEKIAALERKIADLHADDRIAEIEGRMKPALERLRADVERLGS